MSIACCFPLVECVSCLACARWAWKRCLRNAADDSETWGLATPEEFEPVPRICRYILSVYEDDIEHPLWAPPRGYGMNPRWVLCHKTYEDTFGRAPPYLIYLDNDHADVVLAIKGLSLDKETDYALLLDNKLGKMKLDGGYVHNGLLKAATWILDAECDVLRELLEKNPNYTLTFAGHSLGSGVAAMLAILAVQNGDKLGNVERKRIRCYAIAAARCMSLNLAVRYADVINSVVLQDDFLPRTATPLEDMFKSLFCLPCHLCMRCMRDTCISDDVKLRDPRRLYAPGRLYHIIERKPFRCGRYPPVVRTGVPVDGRFEHVVLSCNATSDHQIIWIERETQWAFDLMLQEDQKMEIPPKLRMERQATLEREHRAALARAMTLEVPDESLPPSAYGTFEENSSRVAEVPSASSTKRCQKLSWDKLIERAFDKDESGKMVPRQTTSSEGS